MEAWLPSLYVGLLIAGILLIGAEIYIPGGVMGVLGAVCLFSAAIAGFSFGTAAGFLSASAIILGSIIGFWWWLKVFPKTRPGRRLSLERDGKDFKNEGDDLKALVGREGVAITQLRPSGIAQIDDRRHDVTAGDLWLPSGTRVRVTTVTGHRIEVAPVEPLPQGSAPA